jgi:hypothetical protein
MSIWAVTYHLARDPTVLSVDIHAPDKKAAEAEFHRKFIGRVLSVHCRAHLKLYNKKKP